MYDEAIEIQKTRDESILGRQRSVMAIDEGLNQILDALRATGQLDNTVVVVASDNGYFYGEHGLSVERRLAYEESIRMPLLVRYPKAVKPGTVRDEFALNPLIARSNTSIPIFTFRCKDRVNLDSAVSYSIGIAPTNFRRLRCRHS
jgi:hypothetical protein